MQRLNKEFEQFFLDYFQEHEQLMAEIDKWISKTDHDLNKLASQTSKFENKFEGRMEKQNRHFANTQRELEIKFSE